MQKQDGDLIYESDLNCFDLKEDDLSAIASPVIKQRDNPIGIYRVIYKNGLQISSYVEKLS